MLKFSNLQDLGFYHFYFSTYFCKSLLISAMLIKFTARSLAEL